MTEDMPKRYPYLHLETSRHGQRRWYVRIGKGKRTRIHGSYGSHEFVEEYRAALSGTPIRQTGQRPTDTKSLEWLFEQWRHSSKWASTKPSTRKLRENVLRHVMEVSGDKPYAAITKTHILDGRERRKNTPHAANNFVKIMRAFLSWAEEMGFIESNPARGVPLISAKGDGLAAWSVEDLNQYRNRWQLGTRERVAVEVLFCTGLRRSDAVRLGRQHLRNGIFEIRAEKTGTGLCLPLLPDLQAAISAGPTGDLTYICGAAGRPMAAASFGNWFRQACNQAGITKSAHGIRKLVPTLMAENGGTVSELKASLGWSSDAQPAHYTRSADKKRLARQAAQKLISHPSLARTSK